MYRKNIKMNAMVLLSFLLGVIIAFQVRTVSQSSGVIKFKSINELKKQIESEEAEIENRSKLIIQKKLELYNYKKELEDTGSILASLEKERNQKMMVSGVLPVSGPGIVIRVSDSKKELKEGENPNDKIVHDQDVLHILNDLRISGAEAISISGQRISILSEIKCNGPTITINDRTYGQPFIVSVIGDQEDLMNAIKDPESYSYLLKTVYGLEIEAEIKENIVIPGYQKNIELKYMKEAK